MKPIFSIIIPIYNRAEKLRRALESVENQSLRDYEVIVCDDGSTDDTRSVVDAFAAKMQITYLWEKNWGGPARPRNNGIRAAQGEWLCFLDADDLWYPEKLKVAARYLSVSDIIYHDLDKYPPGALPIRKKMRGRQLKSPAFVDLMVNGNTICNSSVVVMKRIVVEAGGFSEDKSLIAVEDFDLWLKIARLTERFTYIPSSLGAYWCGEDSITEVSDRQIKRIKTVFANHACYLSNDAKEQSELLFCFMSAKIKQQMGLFDEAFKLFRRTAKMRHLRFKLNSLVMISLLRCRAFLPKMLLKKL
ncbi:MAG: glycosyltransferase [Nitrospirae bacterium]|nr:glycosyltransferase [Nitrospirota bacterium]